MSEYRLSADDLTATQECPRCGYRASETRVDDLPPPAPTRPWRASNRRAVLAYVESLGEEKHEWLLALYVDAHLNLLAVETVARGGITECSFSFRNLYARGFALGAKGFFLVHNHPSGDPTPSQLDLNATRRLRNLSADLDMPLLEHFVVASGGVTTVGGL